MLVLTRRHNEVVVLTHTDGTRIEIIVDLSSRGGASLKIEAPQHIRILRKEIEDREKV